MITSVDTNLLFDVLQPQSLHSERSEERLRKVRQAGEIVISEPVYAELAARFAEVSDLDDFLVELEITISHSSAQTLHRAGRAWREYTARRSPRLACPSCGTTHIVHCQRCGAAIQTRQHMLPDFIISAHALTQADSLLTRDRGYYQTYFPELVLA